MKQLFVLSIIILELILLPFVVSADSKQEAIIIFNESSRLLKQARSQDDLEKAAEGFERAFRSFQRFGLEKEAALAANQTGVTFARLGEFLRALEYYEKALNLGKRLGDRRSQASVLNNLGNTSRILGRYADANKYLKNALAICQDTGDVYLQASSLNNLGLVHKQMELSKEAEEYYEQALELAKKVGRRDLEATTLNNIADMRFSAREYQKALEAWEKCLALFQDLGDKRLEGGVLQNMAGPLMAWGQYPKALDYMDKSLQISSRLGDKHSEAVTLHNLGHLYELTGLNQKGLESLERSRDLKQKIGDLQGLAETLCVMGALYSSMGQKDKAMENYDAAIAVRKRLGVRYEDIQQLLAKVYLDIGDLDRAEDLLKQGNHPVFLGALALARSDYWGALAKFEEQLAVPVKNQTVYGLFEANTGLGMAYESLGEFKKAADHFEQAINITEEMRDALPEAQRSSFYDVTVWYFRRISPYEGLARVLLRSGSTVESLKWAESTKARAFAESISRRSGDIYFDIPKDVMERDREINDSLAAASKGFQDAIAQGNQEAIGVLERRVRELRKVRDAHVGNLRKEYPVLAATKYPQPFFIENAALKDDERVLEFQVTDSGVCIYLTLGKSIVKAAFRPVARKELDRLVSRFREPMEMVSGQTTLFEKLKSFDFAAGRELAELLLGDLLEDLPRDAQLIIIPDDSLGVLPFEMLVLNSTGSVSTDGKTPQIRGCEFFGDRNPISYYQSITALTLTRNVHQGKAQGEQLLVFADPVFQLKDERAQRAPRFEKTGSDAKFYSQLMATMEDTKGTGVSFSRLPLTEELASRLGKFSRGKSRPTVVLRLARKTS